MRLLRRLGDGASSEVWLAEHQPLDRQVALKVAHSAAHAGTLADEAQRLLLADSPYLAGVLDAGRLPATLVAPDGRTLPRGAVYVALEWVDGEALAPAAVAPGERVEVALAVARDVGFALADLHAGGTAHGDVKPANVIISGRGTERRAHLVDLGLGDAVDARVPRGATMRYLAPEVTAAPGTGDAAARDLWALGLTLVELAVAGAAASPRPWEAVASVTDPALRELAAALLAPDPAGRALPGWVARRAASLRAEPDAERLTLARRRAAIQRAYLAVRRTELAAAAQAGRVSIEVEGEPSRWLALAVERERAVAALRGARRSDALVLRELDAFGKARWLVRLAGSTAADWPSLATSDGELAARLLALAEQGPLECLTALSLATGSFDAEPASADPVTLALELATGRASADVIDAAEARVRSGEGPPSLGIALGRALRLRGETSRALAVLGAIGTPEAAVHAAEAARRARDRVGCQAWLERASAGDGRSFANQRAATAARARLDSGDAAGALAALTGAGESAPTLEVRALALAALGEREPARLAIERAWTLARDHEDRARTAGVRANLLHAAGDYVAALDWFRRAASHAVEAGAVLEEATYLTGVAAAAARFGYLGEAIEAAGRATLLFEHLGRPSEAARSALGRASAFAQLGLVTETQESARDAIARARAGGDRVCQAYAHLALADVAPASDPDALEHALRARALLADGDPEARLRAESRVLRRGGETVVGEYDRVASSPAVAADARLEWWGARAARQLATAERAGASVVVAELSIGTTSVGMPAVRGPALADGAALATLLGDGDTARRLVRAAADCARDLADKVPVELRARFLAMPWVAATAVESTPLTPAQIADLETLVRALGARDRLRPLLDQALDALVLWTGVERGLLLLRAPGGRLVPRAARNLRRDDLVGMQRELSHSLAERAAAECEPVVAVDAAGELPEVHRSVHALKLRSVLAVPLVSRGEVLGVVYLDDRVRRGAFGPAELAWVRLVATLAAVAIADARDQLLLRRAVRRAERAERRVVEQLAHREAALDAAERSLARERGARDTRHPYDDFVGASPPLQALLRLVDRVSATEVPVLVVGESGSGKELVARALHRNGSRAKAPFVTENCSAIPEALLESALFGHVRGAFTGADRPRAGLFDVASGGTLFLDEIGEMSLPMQAKLLRVLETGEVRPVGSDRIRRVDVRIVAATHRDLRHLVATGRFREDLWYRLDVITIAVAPLRERTGDVDLLVRHFVAKHAPGRRVRLLPEALAALRRHPWPGNVRQLENEIRRALVLSDDIIGLEHLSPALATPAETGDVADAGLDLRRRVDALEQELVREALGRTRGNQTRAAELLGLSRFGLQKMMKRLNIPAVVVESPAKVKSN